ncbi:MAG: [Fe-Fe] hydrogenase large subunit C-terminal domain-containing protein [Bacillota bacterium]|nr:[Fe-Fe] hydrogenase large subunit C-terminal domain-containing protein [Bacillota bacterium]
MNSDEYRELFQELVRAYYRDVFEEKINQLLSDQQVNRAELSKVISVLCGVDVADSKTFSSDIKEAVENYIQNHRVVHRIRACTLECVDVEGKTICQAACPFDAIFYDDNGQQQINEELCQQCGNCVAHCKCGAVLDRKEFLPLAALLRQGEPVFAAVAPSIAGQFGENVTNNQLRTAFKSMGFKDMVEVAFFADMLTLKEASEFNQKVLTKDDFLLSSCCCPVWTGMLKGKYYDLVKYSSPSISPMIASGRVMKALNPDIKVVFIGPCIAKKVEARDPELKGAIDFVLTYRELGDIFAALDIQPEDLPEDVSPQYASRLGRMYGKVGGVSQSIYEAVKRLFPQKAELFSSRQANGAAECKALLQEILEKGVEETFIEGMGCIGGCVGGPRVLLPVEDGTRHVEQYADEALIRVRPNRRPYMEEILEGLGIYSFSDFTDPEKMQIFEREF